MPERILIVEDENVVALDLKTRLLGLGYDVAGMVASGEAAMEAAQLDQPTLILMDINLKGNVDGVEAAQHIWSQYRIPVIFLTAYADDETLSRASQTEPYGYLIKPFEDRTLRSTIRIALHKHRISEDLRYMTRTMDAMLRSTPAGIYIIDASGSTTYANTQMAGICGFSTPEDLITTYPPDIMTGFNAYDEQGNRLSPELLPGQVALRGEQPEPLTISIEQKVGAPRRWVNVTAVPLYDQWGSLEHVVITVQDITRLKRAEIERETLIADLDAYARTVAHDLRGPAAIIVGFAEELAESAPSMSSDDLLSLHNIIADHARRLIHIIEELLLLARSQRDEIDLETLDMSAITAQVIERLAPLIEERAADVTLPDTWPALIGYPQWVEEVLVNYLSNALKYTERQPVVAVSVDAQPDGFARISIQDNGPGIPPDRRRALYKEFSRLHPEKQDGLGLGLSIVRRIISRLGGTVGVESDEGSGSTFWFTLRLANAVPGSMNHSDGTGH